MAFKVNGFDITINRFDAGFSVNWNIKDSNGQEVDLTGYEAQFIVKTASYQEDSDAIVNQQLIPNGSVITYEIGTALTNNPSGTYHYGLRIYKGGTFVNTILQGKIIICGTTFGSEAVYE